MTTPKNLNLDGLIKGERPIQKIDGIEYAGDTQNKTLLKTALFFAGALDGSEYFNPAAWPYRHNIGPAYFLIERIKLHKDLKGNFKAEILWRQKEALTKFRLLLETSRRPYRKTIFFDEIIRHGLSISLEHDTTGKPLS